MLHEATKYKGIYEKKELAFKPLHSRKEKKTCWEHFGINVDKEVNILFYVTGSIPTGVGLYIHLSNKYLSVSYALCSFPDIGIQWGTK